jgi:hypothetical protein
MFCLKKSFIENPPFVSVKDNITGLQSLVSHAVSRDPKSGDWEKGSYSHKGVKHARDAKIREPLLGFPFALFAPLRFISG